MAFKPFAIEPTVKPQVGVVEKMNSTFKNGVVVLAMVMGSAAFAQDAPSASGGFLQSIKNAASGAANVACANKGVTSTVLGIFTGTGPLAAAGVEKGCEANAKNQPAPQAAKSDQSVQEVGANAVGGAVGNPLKAISDKFSSPGRTVQKQVAEQPAVQDSAPAAQAQDSTQNGSVFGGLSSLGDKLKKMHAENAARHAAEQQNAPSNMSPN